MSVLCLEMLFVKMAAALTQTRVSDVNVTQATSMMWTVIVVMVMFQPFLLLFRPEMHNYQLIKNFIIIQM